MTRRELREHCFKLLFCADFYPTDEMQEQVDVYFTEPKEEDDVPSGIGDIIHNPMLDTFDGGYVKSKVEKILDVLPEDYQHIAGTSEYGSIMNIFAKYDIQNTMDKLYLVSQFQISSVNFEDSRSKKFEKELKEECEKHH